MTDKFHNMTTIGLAEAEADAFNRAKDLKAALIARLKAEAEVRWPIGASYRITGPGEYSGRVMLLSSLIPSPGFHRRLGTREADPGDYHVLASGRLVTRGATTGDGYGRRHFQVLATRLEPLP